MFCYAGVHIRFLTSKKVVYFIRVRNICATVRRDNTNFRAQHTNLKFFSSFKMFQQGDTFCTVFYSLQTALHISGETFIHHQEPE
jgi:hypothetical protein